MPFGNLSADTVDRQSAALRVLVAEDSSITQDLLKLVLSQRGYAVDIVDDGPTALEALQRNEYDVALIDFHLPGMDGVDLVASYLEVATGTPPRFLAVTGDTEGLLAHARDCEHFDAIVPKPVDIEEVCRLIEVPSPEQPDPARFTAHVAPRAVKETPVWETLARSYELLVWPRDFADAASGSRLAEAVRTPDRFDIVAVAADAPLVHPERLWRQAGIHLLPIVDLSGRFGKKADLDLSQNSAAATAQLSGIIREVRDRRARLHRDFLATKDLGEKLLAHLFVLGRDLVPVNDAASPLLYAYPLPLPDAEVLAICQKLVSQGVLDARFVDRVHVCPSCSSAHLNVREECPSCGSAELTEEAYLHHFACAYQGPEADFRQGDDLVCPKCAKALRHFGHDYDRPGSMLVCASCGQASSEPDVGFCCAGCGTHSDGERVGTRDIFSYALTDKAIGFAEAGRAALGLDGHGLRFADLPLELVVALNEQARLYNDDGSPFALVDLAYVNQRVIERDLGARLFAAARAQFVENLGQFLPDGSRAVMGPAFDFALVPGISAQSLRPRLDEAVTRARAGLVCELEVAASIFGPKDLF